jgi:hypothetical protein
MGRVVFSHVGQNCGMTQFGAPRRPPPTTMRELSIEERGATGKEHIRCWRETRRWKCRRWECQTQPGRAGFIPKSPAWSHVALCSLSLSDWGPAE